jgi:protease I
MKKVLLIIAHAGFQPIEYGDTKKVLEEAGVQIVTGSNVPGPATSKTGEQVMVDVVLSEVKVKEYDGIFFIGGPGALDNLNVEESYGIIHETIVLGKLWGAICIAPRILAEAGVLEGKKVTGWNEDNDLPRILEKAGAIYVADHVVVDDKLITADGPDATEEFGRAILSKLA